MKITINNQKIDQNANKIEVFNKPTNKIPYKKIRWIDEINEVTLTSFF